MSNLSLNIGKSELSPDAVVARIDFIVGSELTHALHLLSVERDATLFMTLHTTLAILLYRHIGQEVKAADDITKAQQLEAASQAAEDPRQNNSVKSPNAPGTAAGH